ncbi:MAG TPA: hypothetical protein VIM79_13810 [Niastella sp.]
MRIGLRVIVLFFIAYSAKAQKQEQQQPDTSFKPSGKLWGYTFADYYYKAHADSLNRGGANQYSNIEKGRDAFQIRRIYLGYNYEIHPKFSAEFLLAAEDNNVTRTLQPTGDLLTDNKLTVYIKLANLRWKNIWKGTDLVVGQMATPAYALLAEPIWGYRSIERTITDIRRVPSFDLGAALQGKFDPGKGNFGYDLMISNGTGARPEGDKFKWLAGDIYAKLLDKKLVLQLYADYQRMNWTKGFHHARSMLKGFASYVTPGITAGAEAFYSYGRQDVVGFYGTVNDTISARSRGISLFVRGNIIKDKLLFFARGDWFNPDVNYNEQLYEGYKALTSTFEPNNKENFFTAGVDFMPVKNVHFMPNIWYNRYSSERHDATGREKHDYDLVYRITFYYIYGK